MVGRFAGWLIYFPALPNWVSMFQNSTGGSSTSFTLQAVWDIEDLSGGM